MWIYIDFDIDIYVDKNVDVTLDIDEGLDTDIMYPPIPQNEGSDSETMEVKESDTR